MLETKTAYWDWQHDGTHFCSNCGHDALYNYEHKEICSNFCSHCGKLMIDIEYPNMDWVPCTECINFDECENKENCDGCYAGEREYEKPEEDRNIPTSNDCLNSFVSVVHEK